MENNNNISNHSNQYEKNEIIPATNRSDKDSEKKVIPYDSGRLETEEKILHKDKEESEIKDNAKKIEEVDSQKKSINCLDKFCGQKEVGGSISGAIFAMTSLSIGTGCLTFTKRVIQFGFVWFGVFLFIGGLATYWTLVGLINAAKKQKDTEFSSIVRKTIGKFPAIMVDVMTCIYAWGLITTYEIILNSLIGRIAYIFFIDKNRYATFKNYEQDVWDSIKIKAIVLIIVNGLLIPLCLKKDIGKMKIFTLLGIGSLFYTILVLIVECPFFWSHYLHKVYVKEDKSTHANWIDMTRSFNKNLDFFTGFATIIFAYSCHHGALPVYRSLENNNDDSTMKKVFIRSTILDLIIYFSIYISSFLTTPLKSEDLIIYRETIFNNDIFMNIAQISVFLELFFLIPSNYNSFRCSLFHIIFGNEDVRLIPNIILTICTLVVSALIGAVYSKISNYISMLGGICCTTYCFSVPGSVMIKNEWNEMSKTKRIFTIIGIGLLSIIGYTGGIMSIVLCFIDTD